MLRERLQVREAIDGLLARAPQEHRARAVTEIRSMSSRSLPSFKGAPDRIVDEEREAVSRPGDRRRRR